MKLPSFVLFAVAATQTGGSAVLSRAPCTGNTATTRSQWCDFDINTDYYDIVPDTGVIREYFFNLEQVTTAPDGFSRVAYAINGTIPAPTIIADWGDIVVIHVTNNLGIAQNGTSIHFHGIRQNRTNEMDGVVSITQCPTPPGSTITYTWRATQYGSSWYHSHFGFQAWDGAAGGMIINGPATANYDEDKGIVLLSDWNHRTASELYSETLTKGPPGISNAIINGTNIWKDESGTTVGTRFNTSVTAGKSYRLRLVNGGIDTHFKFSIDNHTMTVIAADFVPIVPYETTLLNIGMGQRYDVIVQANQHSVADNFWIRAEPQTACSSQNSNQGNILGILYYGNKPDTPTTKGYAYKVAACEDESLDNLVPHVARSAGKEHWSDLELADLIQQENVFLWALNETSFYVDWANPTLLQVYNDEKEFTHRSHVIQLDEKNQWVYVIIQAQNAASHPIHLHGHDFYILGQGTGTYNSTQQRSLSNPTRRDVALLPGSGYLVLAFVTDNPGAWLMHCHIGWHTNTGLALQFVEQYGAARGLINHDFLNSTCEAWSRYVSRTSIKQGVYEDGI
ncbi:Laccase-2 [Metarhizium brunneum]|uniref:Laccase 1 n=1 Tax=Metarhizium brunneum TaxID=500148 RepID=A0A7D5UY50_9HYPO